MCAGMCGYNLVQYIDLCVGVHEPVASSLSWLSMPMLLRLLLPASGQSDKGNCDGAVEASTAAAVVGCNGHGGGGGGRAVAATAEPVEAVIVTAAVTTMVIAPAETAAEGAVTKVIAMVNR